MSPSIIFVIVGAIAFFALIIGVITFSRRREATNWHQAARDLGLEYIPPQSFLGRGAVEGVYKGYKVRVFTKTSTDRSLMTPQNNKSHETTCVFTEAHPALIPGLLILREYKIFGGFSLKMSTVDIQTGDKAFDDLYTVAAHKEGEALEFLNPDLRAALIELASIAGGMALESKGLSVFSQQALTPQALVDLIEAEHRVIDAACKSQERIILG